MMVIYDMNTGQRIDTRQMDSTSAHSSVQDVGLPLNLGLQEILTPSHYREEPRITPELALADLNAFLDEMS